MTGRHRAALRLLLSLVMLCATCVEAEAQTVTKRFNNETLKNILEEVERQTKMSFIYNTDAINEEKRTTVSFHRTGIKEVLRSVLDKDTKYIIEKRLIILYKDPEDTKTETRKEQPRNLVRGMVTDIAGHPLAGAAIYCREEKKRTFTNADGEFGIDVPPGSTIRASYLGFDAKETKTDRRDFLTIRLRENIMELEETVVIGYGTTTRRGITGAVDQVKSDAIKNIPGHNVTEKLQGTAPSLIIQQKDFNPNNITTNINIRGISTTNSNMPLIVIDGMVSPDNSMDNLNPNDIDNISILKDAGAAAIYGSRSANGAILVTTKKGSRNEKTTVRLSMATGWQMPHIHYHPVQGYRNAQMRNETLNNSGLPEEFTEEQVMDLYRHRGEEEWFLDQIFRTAMQQEYNVSVTGGSRKMTYMVSAGYFDQESNYTGNKGYGVQKYNVRSNLTAEIGKMRFQALMAFSQLNSLSTTGTSLERDASRVPPYYYYKMKEEGRYMINDILSEFNPLGSLEAGGTSKTRESNFTINMTAELDVARGLKLKGVFGADVSGAHGYTRQLTVPYYTNIYQLKPVRYDRATRKAGDTNRDSYMTNSQLLLDYDRKKGLHSLSGMFGITNESTSNNANGMTVIYSNADLGTSASDGAYVKLGDGTMLSPEDFRRTGITSVLGRATYNYADRYFGEFDFRYDASSKFSKSNRWGFFPSVSGGWRLSEEKFMKGYKKHMGDLKLRGSYGILGNQTIGAYDRFTTYDLYNYTYSFNNNAVTAAGFTLGYNDLRWEKTHTLNFGVDASLLRHRLNITFDCFYKRTKDILMRPVTPTVFGTNPSMRNIGEMSNKGWELSVKYNARTGQVEHAVAANIGDTYNRLEKFPEGEQISQLEELWILRKTGVPISSYYGYKTDGFFNSYEEIASSALPVGVRVQPGDLKFVDRNGDRIIDSNDRFILGNAFPRYTFGLSYSLKWKGLDMSMLLNGVGKRDMMVRGELVEPFYGNYSYVIYQHQLDYWREDNPGAHFPRLASPGSSSSSNNYRIGSDIYIFNGAYVRLKNITVGYTVPRKLTMKMGINKLRVYAIGQNLLTLSHNSFIDPESTEFDGRMVYEGANTGCNYPTLKYVGIGMDVEF